MTKFFNVIGDYVSEERDLITDEKSYEFPVAKNAVLTGDSFQDFFNLVTDSLISVEDTAADDISNGETPAAVADYAEETVKKSSAYTAIPIIKTDAQAEAGNHTAASEEEAQMAEDTFANTAEYVKIISVEDNSGLNYRYKSTENKTTETVIGTDTVIAAEYASEENMYIVKDSGVTINATAGDDTIIISNSASDVIVNAGAGDDIIATSGQNIYIDGGEGTDSAIIYGGSATVANVEKIHVAGGNVTVNTPDKVEAISVADGFNGIITINGNDGKDIYVGNTDKWYVVDGNMVNNAGGQIIGAGRKEGDSYTVTFVDAANSMKNYKYGDSMENSFYGAAGIKDEFYFGNNSGNDSLYNAGAEDTLKLWNINDIDSLSISYDSDKAVLSDGINSLNVYGGFADGMTMITADNSTYTYNAGDKSWNRKAK